MRLLIARIANNRPRQNIAVVMDLLKSTILPMHPRIVLLAIMATFLSACSGGVSGGQTADLPLTMKSPSFGDGETMPVRFTCDGEGISPSIEIGSVPAGTRTLALVMDDLNSPSGHFVHWVVWDISPNIKEVTEGAIPSGAMEGTTSAQTTGYHPPCPPAGSGPHHYQFSLYAVHDGISLSFEATRAMLEQQMKGKVLSIAKWTGVYERRE